MSEEDIDLDRVVTDPDYRRAVIEFLNGGSVRGTDAMETKQQHASVLG